MKFSKIPGRRARRLPIAILLGLSLLASPTCKSEEDSSDEDLLLLAGLASTFTAKNPGSCNFTFGSRSVPMQEVTLGSNASSTLPNGFTFLFRNWVAVHVPAVTATTTVAFNFTPFYLAGGNTYHLVYNEAACPINNASRADLNYTFPDLANARTPTNYTVSGNTFSFNGSAAGKDFTIIAVTSNPPASANVTRTN